MKKIIAQRRLEEVIDRNRTPSHRFMRFLEELTGNSNDVIDALTGLYEFDDLFEHEDKKRRYITLQSSDYTSIGTETIVCNNNITVKLNDQPDDFEEAIVIMNTEDGDVTIDGNGRNIIGEPSYIMGVRYQSINLLYTIETDEWLIV